MPRLAPCRLLAAALTATLLLGAAAATTAITSPASPAQAADETVRLTPIKEYNQPNGSNWCWLAVTQMVSYTLRGTTLDQCTLWVRVKGGSTYNCSANYGVRADANTLKNALKADSVTKTTSLAVNWNNNGVTMRDALVTSLKNKKPVILMVRLGAYANHWIYVYGYKKSGSEVTFYYRDPQASVEGEKSVTWTNLKRQSVGTSTVPIFVEGIHSIAK
jgi:hypothetical protein